MARAVFPRHPQVTREYEVVRLRAKLEQLRLAATRARYRDKRARKYQRELFEIGGLISGCEKAIARLTLAKGFR